MTVQEESIRWGILATGGVARAFTADLLLHGHAVQAVGSRSLESATAFADEFGIPRAHGSYEALVDDPDVDVIYVATPHNFHAGNAALALEHGKHVLVEKAFTLNAAEAHRLAELGERTGLVVLEAMWTRFLPHMRRIRSLVARGDLGQVRAVHADHAQRLPTSDEHRLNRLDLAGGALLDLGIYPVSFTWDILGRPGEIQASATFKPTGVDASVATIFRYPDGAISTTYSSSEARGPNTAQILGTEARIEIDSTWYTPTKVTVYDNGGRVLSEFDEPVTGRGMQYQAEEVERLIREGKTQSELLPPLESARIMETMDAIRNTISLRYPGE